MRRFTRDEEGEIARRVYRQWKEGARIIEANGNKPAPLESIGRSEIDHAANFTDPDELKTLTRAAIVRIKRAVVEYSKTWDASFI